MILRIEWLCQNEFNILLSNCLEVMQNKCINNVTSALKINFHELGGHDNQVNIVSVLLIEQLYEKF